MSALRYTTMASPLGPILLVADDAGLVRLYMDADEVAEADLGEAVETPVLARARDQLDAYFAGALRVFDVPLAPSGTAFQQRVWAALREIPYGATVSYKDIAERIGNPKAVRAVGLANGANPIGIIVPCHRVIGSSGKLTGYAGGLWRKERLLALERGEAALFAS
jgi:methylated-DNA-[protein]-cysteine S-methyltransferase